MTNIHSCSYYCDRPNCIKAQRDELRERLAQSEQEPVAWGVFEGTNLHDIFFTEQDAQDMARLKGDWPVVKLLYTTPPQRKPLTDEEIKAVVASIDPDEQYLPKALKQLARAIEAAHGIKENT